MYVFYVCLSVCLAVRLHACMSCMHACVDGWMDGCMFDVCMYAYKHVHMQNFIGPQILQVKGFHGSDACAKWRAALQQATLYCLGFRV